MRYRLCLKDPAVQPQTGCVVEGRQDEEQGEGRG